MTKSKKRSSNRRRHRRFRKKQESSESSSQDVDNDDIQAQLERQRRKRALKTEDASSRTLTSNTFLGGYEYDEKSNTYFPKGTKGSRPRIDSTSNDVSNDTQSTISILNSFTTMPRSRLSIDETPTAWIDHLVATCSISSRSRVLRELWSGRVLLSAMSVSSSMRRTFDNASKETTGWVSMLPQLKRCLYNQHAMPGAEVPWDIGCKSTLHSSARTFDIQPGFDDLKFPGIASLVDGGIFVRLPKQDPIIWNRQRYMGVEWRKETFYDLKKESHSVRFLPRYSNDYLEMVRLINGPSCDIEIFRIGLDQLDTSHLSSRLKVETSFEINDIAFHPNYGRGSALMSLAPRVTRNACELVLCYDLEKETALNTQVSKYLKSDALCLEHLDENTVLFGHRNGAISLLDVRSGDIHSVSCPDKRSGSTKCLLPLACDKMFIAKKLFGDCHVFDLRKMKTGWNDNASSVVLNLKCPEEMIDRMLSTCCSGIAINPSENVVISPFSDRNRSGRFALWSLSNGNLIGSKSIRNLKPQQGLSRAALPHCELRATVTPSFEIAESQPKHFARSKKNSWSVWFKSGEVEPDAPDCMGSIHQLTFPGNILNK